MNKNIVLYDETCNLCNRSINILRNADVDKNLCFIPLDSLAGKEHVDQLHLSENERNSVIHITDNKYYTKSDAALSILSSLKKFKTFYFLLRLFPRRLRNVTYDIVAKNRFKWFGKNEK